VIGGLAGLGVLGRELAKTGRGTELLDAVIDRLGALAVEDVDGVSWPPITGGQSSADRDLGLAHGQLGPIGLLALAVDRPLARSLLERATAWIISRIQPRPAVSALAFFSSPAGPNDGASRLAWCYGDAGAAVVLWRVAEALHDAAVRDIARDVALRAAERNPENAGVCDAGLCHGAAGLGHLFGRLWQLSNEERCRDAAVMWLRTAVELRSVPGVNAAYPAWDPVRGGFVGELGVLEGTAGVCLALLAATGDSDPDWDRIMLAS
jgi:hypothetical protein